MRIGSKNNDTAGDNNNNNMSKSQSKSKSNSTRAFVAITVAVLFGFLASHAAAQSCGTCNVVAPRGYAAVANSPYRATVPSTVVNRPTVVPAYYTTTYSPGHAAPVAQTAALPALESVPRTLSQPAPRVVTLMPVAGNHPTTPYTVHSPNTSFVGGAYPGTTVVRPYTTFRPIVSLTPAPANVMIGQGILGQPKVYVPGQPVRNFLRYLTP